jgi:hypothetical protein
MNDNRDVIQSFYSQKAIALATYLGGPLAAGYLVKQNFIALGNEDHGKLSLIIGAISTLLIFAAIFSIPEHIIDKIPNALIPGIYMPIIYLIVEKLQGKELQEHKNNNGNFFSLWKATGIGIICTMIYLVVGLGFVFMIPDNFDADKYDAQLALFQNNETQAFLVFDLVEYSDSETVKEFIDLQGIPYWESNIKILDDLDQMEGIYDQLIKQNRILRNYCKLRIEQYQLIRKAVVSESFFDDNEMQKIVEKIDAELAKLN